MGDRTIKLKPFECQYCGVGFTINVFLVNHLKEAHVKWGYYKCGECCCVFNQSKKLHAHQVEQHGFTENLLIKKPQGTTEVATRCDFCGITFHNQIIFKSHMRQKHVDENVPAMSPKEIATINGGNIEEDSKEKNEILKKRGVDDMQEQHDGNKGLTKDMDMESDDDERVQKRKKSHCIEVKDSVVSAPNGVAVGHFSQKPTVNTYNQEEYDDPNDAFVKYVYGDNGNDSDSKENSPEPSSAFVIPNEFDMEPEEAHLSEVNSNNTEKLIDSVPDDDKSPMQTCDLCGSAYANVELLSSHKMTNHVDGGQFPCEQCSCVFASKPDLIVHFDVFHRTTRLAAPDCSLSPFLEPQQVQQQIAIIACNLCVESFEDEKQLSLHKMRNHVTRVVGVRSSNRRHGVKSGHVCHLCGIVFGSKTGLKVHLKYGNHENAPIIDSLAPPTKHRSEKSSPNKLDSALTDHQHFNEAREDSEFRSTECKSILTNAADFQNHKNQFKGSKPITSAGMDVTNDNISNDDDITRFASDVNCKRASKVMTHQKKHHFPGRKFPCTRCKCVYSSLGSLKSHKIAKHKDFAGRCRDCIAQWNNRMNDHLWFCKPCKNPHKTVMAKVGNLYWPAKVLEEDTAKRTMLVMFFGGRHQHGFVSTKTTRDVCIADQHLENEIKNVRSKHDFIEGMLEWETFEAWTKFASQNPKKSKYFEVERIIGKKIENGEVIYLVKWKHFPKFANGWTPKKNLLNCALSIKQFEESEKVVRVEVDRI